MYFLLKKAPEKIEDPGVPSRTLPLRPGLAFNP
jgi:hypothetical protein